MGSRIFLINVGANCSHGPLRSPLFHNNRFDFVPIPESRVSIGCSGSIPIYSDLTRHKGIIPTSYRKRFAHNDPEFDTFTYGDNPIKSPRASVLRRAQVGDYFFFLARLVRYVRGSFTSEAGFYLVGMFRLSDILRDVFQPLDTVQFAKYGRNAHVTRAATCPDLYDGFWVFKGGPGSGKFERAVRFERCFCDIVGGACGREWIWREGKSELQTIGSYTRSCRLLDDSQSVKSFLDRVAIGRD